MTPRQQRGRRLAEGAGLFLLIEPAQGGNPEVWHLYDARDTGRESLTYWPHTGGYFGPGAGPKASGTAASDREAIVIAANRLARRPA